MNYYQLPIYGSTLNRIPRNERVFLVQMCHLLNEVATLYRMIAILNKQKQSDEIGREAWVSTSMMLNRFLAGRVYEAWELLRHSFFNTKLCMDIEPALEPEAQAALEELKKRFKRPARLKRVRQFAFHFNNDEVAKGLAKVNQGFKSKLYVPEKFGNSFYPFAEVLVNQVMLDAEPSKLRNELVSFLNDVFDVAGYLIAFGENATTLIIEKYLGKAVRKQRGNMKTTESVGHIDDTNWPMFIDLTPKPSGSTGDDT